jgi:two-component system sensor histidine kinase BaeS
LTGRLIWKLLGVNILIIGFVIIIVWLTVNYLAADYFLKLMEKYNISPTSIHQMFLSAIHRYLIWASLSAIALAAILSLFLLRQVLGPLSQMTEITRSIAAGDYSQNVPIRTRDEMGQLAKAFNRMAESLQHTEELRKTLVINVAHELRTPLTNMRGYLEALSDQVLQPSPETFALLHEETLRLADLVEDILRLARADAAGRDLHRVRVRMHDLVSQELKAFLAKFRAKKISVENRLGEADDKVWADREKIQRVIQNLLQNALQYTRVGGKIRIDGERLPNALKLTFANTGGELSENDLPFVFERFFRGEKSRSREHGGAGIGLAIVKELIEAHDGQVGARLHDDTFLVWFTLPTGPA